MERRLYRSTTDKFIAGVCGGLGEYFGVDPAFIRILFVLLTFASGFGLLAYLILWVTVRKRTADMPVQAAGTETIDPVAADRSHWTRYLAGIILIVLGVLFFVHENFYWFNLEEIWDKFWPVVLIALGLALILFRKRSPEKAPQYSSTTPHEHNGGATI